MKNVIEFVKARREAAKNDGFSLLELVVAVGILLVLTVGGLLAYNGITNNARQAAVDSAASEIYTAASAYEADNDPKTKAEDAATEWVASQAPGAGFTALAGLNNDGEVWVTVTNNNNGKYAVRGTQPSGV